MRLKSHGLQLKCVDRYMPSNESGRGVKIVLNIDSGEAANSKLSRWICSARRATVVFALMPISLLGDVCGTPAGALLPLLQVVLATL